MLLWWLAPATTGSPEYVTQILQWGPPGVVIVLILTGVLVTKGQLEQMRKIADDWHTAYDKECAAHDDTRAALAEVSKSASASLEVAKTTTVLLSNLGHLANRPGQVP